MRTTQTLRAPTTLDVVVVEGKMVWPSDAAKQAAWLRLFVLRMAKADPLFLDKISENPQTMRIFADDALNASSDETSTLFRQLQNEASIARKKDGRIIGLMTLEEIVFTRTAPEKAPRTKVQKSLQDRLIRTKEIEKPISRAQ